MEVIESLSEPAPGKTFNEDALVATRDFVAVVDGAGDYLRRSFHGKSWGRLAAECVQETITSFVRWVTADQAIAAIHDRLRGQLDQLPAGSTSGPPPTASAVIYSDARREVWRVGDTPFRIDDQEYYRETLFDNRLVDVKRILLEGGHQLGLTENEIRLDLGVVFGLLHKYQSGLQNGAPDGRFTISVLEGRRPPTSPDVRTVPTTARSLVLGSDGYPKLLPTLTETEQFLAQVTSRDPSLINECAQTKLPRAPGPWDDRTYVRLAV